MSVCPKCGRPVAPDSNFCSFCGEPLVRPDTSSTTDTTRLNAAVDDQGLLDELSAEDEGAVEALPAGSALLIVHSGPSMGARFLLDTDHVMAGRHPDSDIFLDDITVSRHHMTFVREGGTFVVEDLGSLNGTYVNRKLAEGRVPLHTGDEVQIGKFRMVYYVSAHGLG